MRFPFKANRLIIVLNPSARTLLNLCSKYTVLMSIRLPFNMHTKQNNQGPVVQSVVSLTNSLKVISLTVLTDSIYNILIFFAEKM